MPISGRNTSIEVKKIRKMTENYQEFAVGELFYFNPPGTETRMVLYPVKDASGCLSCAIKEYCGQQAKDQKDIFTPRCLSRTDNYIVSFRELELERNCVYVPITK